MKKVFLALVLFAGLALTSCTADDADRIAPTGELPLATDVPERITVTASLPGAVIDADKLVNNVWSNINTPSSYLVEQGDEFKFTFSGRPEFQMFISLRYANGYVDNLTPVTVNPSDTKFLTKEIAAKRRAIAQAKSFWQANPNESVNDRYHTRRIINSITLIQRLKNDLAYFEKFILGNLCNFQTDGTYITYSKI